jgi:hypothetical protein
LRGPRFGAEGNRVMALNLVAGIDFPRRLPTAAAPFFLFRTRAAAITHQSVI